MYVSRTRKEYTKYKRKKYWFMNFSKCGHLLLKLSHKSHLPMCAVSVYLKLLTHGTFLSFPTAVVTTYIIHYSRAKKGIVCATEAYQMKHF